MSRRARARFVAALFAAGGALHAGATVDHSVSGPKPLASEDAAALDPAIVERARARQLLVSGDWRGAEAAYRRALETQPSDATIHLELGRLLLESGHRVAARRELDRAVELDPASGVARFALGMADDELGFEWLARRNYRRAFELEPALADPVVHPEVSARRLALAVLIDGWSDDEPAIVVSPDPTDASRSGPPTAPKAPKTDEPAELESPAAGESSGGYARVVGGGKDSDRSFDERSGEASPDGSSDDSASRGRSSQSRNNRVVGPSDLESGAFVNQATTPGDSGRSGGSRGGSKGGGHGSNPRFTPPPRPFQPSFQPDEESTGRIEPLLAPADDQHFAIAG